MKRGYLTSRVNDQDDISLAHDGIEWSGRNNVRIVFFGMGAKSESFGQPIERKFPDKALQPDSQKSTPFVCRRAPALCMSKEPPDMKIWVDADACPVAIREILFRASARTGIRVTLIANSHVPIPRSPHIRMIQVSSGFDITDDEIVKRMESGDLVVTSDIPLAADAIDKGGLVLSPRGERLTKDNIGARLNMRDFMESMRASGVTTGGPSALSQSDRKAFADELDRLLSRKAGNA